MANFTKKAIIQTFQDMLVEMPFDKITVSALAVRCGLSSPTSAFRRYNLKIPTNLRRRK